MALITVLAIGCNDEILVNLFEKTLKSQEWALFRLDSHVLKKSYRHENHMQVEP